MSTVFLIGFMTAGKTKTGKQLAKLLKRPFIDLDRVIEEKEKKSISEIFCERGENDFRKLEADTLLALDLSLNAVVATGGGTPCFHDNMNWMNENGISVWLQISVDAVMKRIAESKKPRPLLANLQGDELKKFVKAKMTEREKFYSQAHIQLSTEGVSLQHLKELIEEK